MHAPRAPQSTTETGGRLGVLAGALTLAGTVLSGPVALGVVAAVGPQPAWRDAATFLAHRHPVQLLPYALGFLLVTGSVMTIVAVARAAPPAAGPRAALALVAAGVFATFVFLNYVLQTTVVPALAASERPALGPLLEALTMSNPRSVGWALEMWGYGFLGAATWLVAPAFADSPLERAAARAFVANGVVSIGSAVLTAIRIDWVFTPAGFAGYSAWNLLMVVLAALTIAVFRRRIPDGARTALRV